MKIGVTGASGFIGTAIIAAGQGSHEFVAYSRNPSRSIAGASEVRDYSDPATADYSGLDAVIHLAGESILGLWSAEKKKRILESRVKGTEALMEGLANMEATDRPKAIISASAVGYYGDRGDEMLDEESDPGFGFLAEVTREWEASVAKATDLGLRVAHGRVGLVLGKNGGAAPMLKKVFSLGLGGNLGSGDQWWPWVHVEDVAKMFLRCAEDDAISGPVNFTGPEAVTNDVFTKAVGDIVKRPTFFAVPKFVLKAAPGGMGEIFLNSQRVAPSVLRLAGYEWVYTSVEQVLRDVLE